MALVLAVGLTAATASGDVVPNDGVPRVEKQERFEKRDLNGDGVLTREEHYAAARTSRYDIDGDGEISDGELIAARELQRARSRGSRAHLLRRYDKDGDGKLSVEERNAARRARRPPSGMGGGRMKVRRGLRGGYRVGR